MARLTRTRWVDLSAAKVVDYAPGSYSTPPPDPDLPPPWIMTLKWTPGEIQLWESLAAAANPQEH